MRIHRNLEALPAFNNAVITIGSFDGIHLGHQRILDQLMVLANNHNGESIVITFHPHPRLVIYPKDNSLRLITTIEEKVDLFSAFGVDHVVIVPFTVKFSQIQADEYIENFLVKYFQPVGIVIGYDHHFGLNRQGNIDYLKWHAKQFGYKVYEIQKQEVDQISISSTKIRRALDTGDVEHAQALLGHPFTLTGKVVRGQQIGQQLGFPTANLAISDPNKLIPPNGIYVVSVWFEDTEFQGMLYIGNRPTLKAYDQQTIEVHIFDFNQVIYGKTLKVALLSYIRDDQSFADLDALKAQLAIDQKESLAYFEGQKKKTTLPLQQVKVAVVVLNYNGLNWLQSFLPTLIMHTPSIYQIVIADNGSTDKSQEWTNEHYPEVHWLALEANHGFANGYNLALRQIDSEYYLLLNSDVAVDENWLSPMLELLDTHPSIAACQPKILSYHQPNHFEYAGAAGGWMDFLGYPFCRGRVFDVTEEDVGQYDAPQPIFWGSGAALLVRSHLFHGVGGFDPDYFAHSEEIDLCWRLQRAGYEIYAAPAARVYHVGGGTLQYQSAHKAFLNFRNSLFTIVKNEPIGKILWLLPLRLILDGVAGGLFLVQGKWDHILAIIKAHGSFYWQWRKTWRRRIVATEKIKSISIGPSKIQGRYAGSIVWNYFILGKKKFEELTSK